MRRFASLRRMSNTPHSLTLHNPKNHRKSLEFCVAPCSLEFSVDSNSESNSTESKQFTQSTTLKTQTRLCPLKYIGAQAPTAPRPCRGVKNALRKCRSAFLAFLTRQGKSEALSPIAEKEKRRFIFFGAGESGERGNPFFFCANKR